MENMVYRTKENGLRLAKYPSAAKFEIPVCCCHIQRTFTCNAQSKHIICTFANSSYSNEHCCSLCCYYSYRTNAFCLLNISLISLCSMCVWNGMDTHITESRRKKQQQLSNNCNNNVSNDSSKCFNDDYDDKKCN